MLKRILFFVLPLSFTFWSCAELEKAAKVAAQNAGSLTVTPAEASQGLKAALKVGTDTAVSQLTRVNGFYGNSLLKILLPPEAKPIVDNISKVPVGKDLLEKAITGINRAAEDAAKEAGPIFANAITSMSINDAFAILRGVDTAATNYLRRNTSSQLVNAFTPKISTSLNKKIVFNTSGEDLYKNLINAYNTASLKGALFPQVTSNTLTQYVTNRAVDGVFIKIGEEERKIRNNIAHRVSPILKKVFGQKY